LDGLGRADPEFGVPAEAEKWDRFHEAVDQLPDDEKQVIELRCYGQWSRQETAVIIGVEERTVTRRYGRAIEKLGAALQRAIAE
jgi:RNA polymerase sigma factor (sigma-70 family)